MSLPGDRAHTTLSHMQRENHFNIDLSDVPGGRKGLEKEAAAWTKEIGATKVNLGAYLRMLINTHPRRQPKEKRR